MPGTRLEHADGEREPGGEHRMNVWQGDFPARNSEADGYYGTAPVGSFPPNGYGLHNMTGNVSAPRMATRAIRTSRTRPRHSSSSSSARRRPRCRAPSSSRPARKPE
ncbi:MAG: SUMF1/EgtB/PvdO family nonheme iron enzyme [Solirubrobacterales bacterium]